ncbi:MAG: DUF2892 domain-containing protein [Simkania sp.]|nr:DUF2892 domain-containing protein [Simkania sp.]
MSLKLPRNIDTSGRVIRLSIGILVLGYACWKMSWIALILALFIFFEALTSWCIVYHIFGIHNCPTKKKR